MAKYFDHTFFRFFFGFIGILLVSFAVLFVALQWNKQERISESSATYVEANAFHAYSNY